MNPENEYIAREEAGRVQDALTRFAHQSRENAEDAILLVCILEGVPVHTLSQRAAQLKREGVLTQQSCSIPAIMQRATALARHLHSVLESDQ